MSSRDERSSKLSDEIVATQQSRSEYLKWKLVLVAALGAVGLGLDEKISAAPLLLALIPWVCVYVDLLCGSLNARLILIGTFYAKKRHDEYEEFVQKNRDVFTVEDAALYWSTLALCGILLIFGVAGMLWKPSKGEPRKIHLTTDGAHTNSSIPQKATVTFDESTREAWWQGSDWTGFIIILSALAGGGCSLVTRYKVKRRIEHLCGIVEQKRGSDKKLLRLIQPRYTAQTFAELQSYLDRKACFVFATLPNGLFPAASSADSNDSSGYDNVWVRDNVHIAHAHYQCGDTETAKRNALTLMAFFRKQKGAFQAIINGQTDPNFPMHRPHIRFNGKTLEALDQEWAHDQNDAMGYFLWSFCNLASEGSIEPKEEDIEVLVDFVRFFETIKYWQDKDSGHWEEVRKVAASSIGTVVAGLKSFRKMADDKQLWSNPRLRNHHLTNEKLGQLISAGETALKTILPCESREPIYRRYDSALLFLIYPLEALDRKVSEQILEDVKTHLCGNYGIRRYLGDSYWFPNYKDLFSEAERTGDFSEDMARRDSHVRVGDEAQWCIFDPIVSVIYGRWYREAKKDGRAEDAQRFLEAQTSFLNRSLKQLTPDVSNADRLCMPEAYYLVGGLYVPNDHVPLLWAHANLWLAVTEMQKSLGTEPHA